MFSCKQLLHKKWVSVECTRYIVWSEHMLVCQGFQKTLLRQTLQCMSSWDVAMALAGDHSEGVLPGAWPDDVQLTSRQL